MSFVQDTPLNTLRRGWWVYTVLSGLFLASGYVILQIMWAPAYALRWLVQAGLALVYLLVVLGRNLHANHRPGERELLPRLGWGNHVSLMRGVLLAGLLGFLFSPPPEGALAWLPGILYTLAILADFLDGYLARITNHATRLGEILDMSFDGVGVLGAVVLLAGYGKIPAWYLSIGLARYAFLAGEWMLRRMGRPVYELPPSAGVGRCGGGVS